MDTNFLLITGLTILTAWLSVEITSQLLKSVKDTLELLCSILIATATIYVLFAFGVL